MHKVDLSAKAQKLYKKADKPLAEKLARCFEQLEQDPRHHPNIRQLKGQAQASIAIAWAIIG